MPKYVDHEQRRQEILVATADIIGRDGIKGLTFNAVAKQLGGTVTLVTHYYKVKSELIADLAAFLIEGFEQGLSRIEEGIEDALSRLHAFLAWALPISPEGLAEERGRIRLVAEVENIPEVNIMFKAFDERMRQFIRDHLLPLVGASEIESYVETLRIMTNGICLATVENEAAWPAQRQLAAINHTLKFLGLGEVSIDAHTGMV